MREQWTVEAPAGGWGHPWPQCLELAREIPSTMWTLIGGLMVQLHAANSGKEITRPTEDVDLLLHVETGTATVPGVTGTLRRLGYEILEPMDRKAPAHRFKRGDDQVDVMIADHPAPKVVPKMAGRDMVRVPAGTQALRRTVDCKILLNDGTSVTTSVPNQLGALMLKGAAYVEDSRDRERHLDDAAVLLSTIDHPLELRAQFRGSDRKRINYLQRALNDPHHKSWLLLDERSREQAQGALMLLARG